MTSHLDDNTLRLFAAGRFDAQRVAQVESHLADCTECLERLHRIETEQPSRLIQGIKSARLDDEAESETIGIKAVGEISEFVPGDRIGGNYRLENQVGRGGMGVAWKAYDETAHRYVVLKFVPKELCSFAAHVAEAMASVRESFQKVHALQHQNICPLYGLFNDSKHGLFLVMKFVDGLTLSEYRKQQVRQHGAISFENIVEILASIADGLDYAHRQKVVHRDIKPQNIIISPKDGVQIIDFGLADEIQESLSRTEDSTVKQITGTRSYMAPEQWEGRKQDAKTDQYALAVTAYELLAGHTPFSGTDTEILKNAVLHNSPTPIPDLPKHINVTLLKGLAKNPSERFSSCTEFIEALSRKPARSKIWLLRTIRIGMILILSIGIYVAIYAFLEPLTDPDFSALQYNKNNTSQVEDRRVLPAASQERSTKDNSFGRSESMEKRAKRPSMLDDQWRYQSPPTIIRPQKAVFRTQVFNVLRVIIAIDADGTGKLTAKRGESSERPLPFSGTEFHSHVFDDAMTFRNKNNGMGRILFSLGYLKPIEPSFLEPVRSYGWVYRCFGISYPQGQTRTRFETDNSISSFLNRNDGPIVSNTGVRAGFSIDKSGEFPYTVTYEVVDDTDYPPDFEVILYWNGKDGIENTTILGSWERDHMNRIRMNEFYFRSQSDRRRTVIANNLALDRNMVFTQPFRLPISVIKSVKAVEFGLWTNQLPLQRKQPGFDLTLLDIVGRFKGDVGFRIENKGDAAVVAKDDWNNPVPMLPNAEKLTDKTPLQPGDTVLGINGKTGSAETLQKILDSLHFGDPVMVRYASQSGGDAETSWFHAE